MPEIKINSSAVSEYNTSTYMADFSVAPQDTDGANDQEEIAWENSNWTQQLAYYKTIPELKSSIDALARWTIGKGFTSNEITELALFNIKGHGKDTFNSILENQIRVAKISGDSYAEIIRDDEERFINLKPLNPGTMRIVANHKGLILRYEQLKSGGKAVSKTFAPDKIFHLSRNRTADEIHGVSLIDSVEEIILMRNEAMSDYRKLLHRNVYPTRIHHLDTDDTTQISTYKAKVAQAKGQGEDLFVPKGAVEIELISVPPNATLNPLPWINQLNAYFFQATGVPQIVVGGAQEITEASAKIAYLAWEQTIEEEQLYVEEQVLSQLNLEINLEFPASLQNEMLSDNRKEETMQAATPEDTAVTNTGLEGGAQSGNY